MSLVAPSGCTLARGAVLGAVPLTVLGAGRVHKRASPRTWSKTPGKLWKVGETADGGARENPVFPPFLRLAAASIRRCCTCVPGVFVQMRGGGLARGGGVSVDAPGARHEHRNGVCTQL